MSEEILEQAAEEQEEEQQAVAEESSGEEILDEAKAKVEKEEVDEEASIQGKRKNKETSTKEEVQNPITTQTEGTQKLDAETNSTQPKRRYSKRKPTSRRGQTRGRGRRPYSTRKKLEEDGSKKTTKENSNPSDLIETGEKQFNKLPDNVEVPIIPLPAPYVRPKAKSDSPGSVPDGNVNEG